MGAEIKVLIQQVDISEQHARSSVSARPARRSILHLSIKHAIIQVRQVALPPHGALKARKEESWRKMRARVQQLRRSDAATAPAQGPSTIETELRSNIKSYVIGVVSGKGGVGE